MDTPAQSAPASSPLLVLAIIILSLSLLVLTVFQTFMLMRARQGLETARAAQEQPLQDGAKLRARAESLAGRTAELADTGDVAAKSIVEGFRRQGVELKPAPK